MSGRGSTRVGRPALLPLGAYEPAMPTQRTSEGGLTVTFYGEDGRSCEFAVGRLPLAGWHESLAAAWVQRTGPAGGLRTQASAASSWQALGRFIRFLAGLKRPPAQPSALRGWQVEQFGHARTAAVGPAMGQHDLYLIGSILQSPALRDQMKADVLDVVSRRRSTRLDSKPGYSDGEFDRLVHAARKDVAALRNRIAEGRQLAIAFRDDPDSLPVSQQELASQLGSISTTGIVPAIRGDGWRHVAREGLARNLFLTLPDLAPLLVLLVATTGCNIETVKELPAEHRILEDRAVELRVIKRRRGQRQWISTVTWEIGAARRQLHTPGGLYLLLHELTSWSRAWTGDTKVWALWRNGLRPDVTATIAEHHNPFGKALSATHINAKRWVASHGLLADPALAEAAELPPAAPALVVNFNRIRTSVEVRRTRAAGGHLPTAVRTNSIPVLFASYLRGDPTVIDWAHGLISEAVADAEQSAVDAHRRALTARGGTLQVVTGDGAAADAQTGVAQAAWSSCTDHDHHPETGRVCRSSFLDCFHCGNCLITRQHLPRLLSLLDALAQRRQHLPELEWWSRYGTVWAAIRHDVLVKFSPQELAAAAQSKPQDSLLDLVEMPWERP